MILILAAVLLSPLPQTHQTSTAENLTPQQVKSLEVSAKTARDHERLAAYYRSQLEQAQKNLADAQELLKKWEPAERASKTPDPYPHARRLVSEYSAQVEKYSKLADLHEKKARAIEADQDPEKIKVPEAKSPLVGSGPPR